MLLQVNVVLANGFSKTKSRCLEAMVEHDGNSHMIPLVSMTSSCLVQFSAQSWHTPPIPSVPGRLKKPSGPED
jgi:hypothetical protein